jgi:prepilin-type N-terminal cleavage/methylation domain-containing protein
MKTNSLHRSAFTLVEIMIVVAIIGMLAAIAIPNFVNAKNHAQSVACGKNLQTLFAAKQMWSMEGKHPSTAIPTDDDLFGSGKFIAVKPSCPAGGAYTLNAADQKPACSIANHTY